MKRNDPKILGNMMGARPGTGAALPSPAAREEAAQAKLEGLQLSELCYKPVSFFRPNPDNVIFDALKDEQYFAGLRRDIESAGAILNPIIATMDGLLVEGHSRVKVAAELEAEGKPLGPLPCRLILEDLPPQKLLERVYLGNLSRFELDENTRLSLYDRIWPGFYRIRLGAGRPKAGEPRPPTAEEIAEQTKRTTRQVRRDQALVRRALELAALEGRSDYTDEDLETARAEQNAARKGEGDGKPKVRPAIVVLRVERAAVRIRKLAEATEKKLEMAKELEKAKELEVLEARRKALREALELVSEALSPVEKPVEKPE